MRGFPLVATAAFVQYLLWFIVKTEDVFGKLFGPGSEPRQTLVILGWGVALSVLAATFSTGLVALVSPRRRRGPGTGSDGGRTGVALVLASLMIAGFMLVLSRA